MTKPTTIRLPDDIKEEVIKKGKAWGLTPTLTAAVIFAIRQLPYPKTK